MPLQLPSAACLLQLASSTCRIHVMALDGLINVNSLFSVALFLGLTAAPSSTILVPPPPPPPPSLLRRGSTSCTPATNAMAERLVAFHVYSFSSFLFSSLIALALKQAIKITDWSGSSSDDDDNDCCDTRRVVSTRVVVGHINTAALRVGILVSAAGSVFGCGFLLMALVNLVQIKLGTLSCGSVYTLAAILPLLVLVPSALLIYICLLFYSFKH